ncbi:hypothetical protein LCGC14_3066950, partial [marine sediment metagenome]
FTPSENGTYYWSIRAVEGYGLCKISYSYLLIDHDLSVSLEVPTITEIYSTYTINATVSNAGINNESNVDMFLYLDGVQIDSITVLNLTVGASQTINYTWTPDIFKTYNFTAYAPPVLNETIIINNVVTELITISTLSNYTMTPGAPYVWIDASGGTELFLSDDDNATIPLPFDFTFYNETFSTIYLGSNGYLSFTDTAPREYINVDFPSPNPTHEYMIAPFWDDLDRTSGGNIYVQSFGTYWVAEWANIDRFSGSLVGSFELILYENGDIIFSYDYLDYTSGGYTCGLNLGVDTDYYNSYQGLNDLTDDFSIYFTIILINTAPDKLFNPIPSDAATGVSTNPTLFVNVSDP